MKLKLGFANLVAACVAAIRGGSNPAAKSVEGATAATSGTPLKHRKMTQPWWLPKTANDGMPVALFGQRHQPNQRKRRKLARQTGRHPANPLRA